jgi:hypothetical protein
MEKAGRATLLAFSGGYGRNRKIWLKLILNPFGYVKNNICIYDVY